MQARVTPGSEQGLTQTMGSMKLITNHRGSQGVSGLAKLSWGGPRRQSVALMYRVNGDSEIRQLDSNRKFWSELTWTPVLRITVRWHECLTQEELASALLDIS